MADRGCSLPAQVILIILLWLLPPLSARAEIRVLDDAGHSVVLQQPAKRIVSLAPHVTELLFAAGAGERVVGVSEFSDYPEAAAALARIGGGGGLDLEAIVALQPDLVVAWGSGNPQSQLLRLQSLGLTVYVSEPRQLQDVADTLNRLGQLAGSEAVARAAGQAFRQRYESLRQRYSRQPAVSVFYQIWQQPLMTVNGAHLISDVIGLCGGHNVFDSLPALAPQIDIEAVLGASPDVILIASDTSGQSAEVDAWRRWPELTAVAQGHVYTMQRELLVRHSPRILDGAEQLCGILEKVRREK